MPKRKSTKKKSAIKNAATEQSKRNNAVRKKSTPRKREKGERAGYNTSYQLNTDLPQRYNKTYLRVLPKDPQWLFVYWELSEETVDILKKKVGREQYEAAKPVLCLLDITDIEYNGTNAWKCKKIHVNDSANNRHIKIPEPGRVYILEFRIITQAGKHILIMRSNAVTTPRDRYSDTVDLEWSTVDTKELTAFSMKPYGGAGDSTVQTELFPGSSEHTQHNSSS